MKHREILILGIIAVMLLATVGTATVGTVIAESGIVTVPITEAFSFQNEGTILLVDDTGVLNSQDGTYGPTQLINYYATGTSGGWFDAISARFDIDKINLNKYTTTLVMYLQKGDYGRPEWHHYLVLYGDKNTTYEDDWPQDAPPTGGQAPAAAFYDRTTWQWVAASLDPQQLINSGGWLTIRLWNARVDYVALKLIPKHGALQTPLYETSTKDVHGKVIYHYDPETNEMVFVIQLKNATLTHMEGYRPFISGYRDGSWGYVDFSASQYIIYPSDLNKKGMGVVELRVPRYYKFSTNWLGTTWDDLDPGHYTVNLGLKSQDDWTHPYKTDPLALDFIIPS